MSVWDNIDDDFADNTPSVQEGTFEICFGVETVQVKFEEGMTLKDALLRNSDELGYDRVRKVSWSSGSQMLSEGATPEPGASYTAAVTLEAKGC